MPVVSGALRNEVPIETKGKNINSAPKTGLFSLTFCAYVVKKSCLFNTLWNAILSSTRKIKLRVTDTSRDIQTGFVVGQGVRR